MSHTNESKAHHSIPAVGWHDPGYQKRPGVARPLPLPIHPDLPSIPGGLPGLEAIGTRTGLVGVPSYVKPIYPTNITGRTLLASDSPQPGFHYAIATPPPNAIPGRSGTVPYFPHIGRPVLPHVPHVPRPVLR